MALHLTNDPQLRWSPLVWSLSRGPHCSGSPGGFLLRGTGEEPSNRGVFHGATTYVALMGLLVLVVAVALWLQKRLRLLRWRFSSSCAGSAWLTRWPADSGPGALLLGLACVVTLLALFSAPARARLGRS